MLCDLGCICCYLWRQVSIEYGLSELMNSRAIWYPPADPRNIEVWNLPLDELFRELPSGVVDVSVQPVFAKVSHNPDGLVCCLRNCGELHKELCSV